jgi:hypothetical protein
MEDLKLCWSLLQAGSNGMPYLMLPAAFWITFFVCYLSTVACGGASAPENAKLRSS